MDCDATWTALAGDESALGRRPPAPRAARASAGRSGPVAGGAAAVAALSLYPRIEATGSVGRRFLSAEPLLEHGLALALAFADVAGVQAALVTPR